MPSQTSFAKLYLYNDTDDKQKKFIEFRSNLCGLAEDSSMNKIDSILSSHDTSIKGINDKLDGIFTDVGGEQVVNASFLNMKKDSYFENVAGTYNASCSYSTNQYSLTLLNNEIEITESIFTLRFASPNEWVDGSNFLFDGNVYTPVDPAFISGQIVLLNLNKDTKMCYFSSGSGKGEAIDITVSEIPGISAGNVQDALSELLEKINKNVQDIVSINQNITNIVDGTTPVAEATHSTNADNAINATNAENSSTLEGKDLAYIMDYNNLTNKPTEGGLVVSSEQPDVSRNTILWVDLGNNAILKYSDGDQWIPVGSVWK